MMQSCGWRHHAGRFMLRCDDKSRMKFGRVLGVQASNQRRAIALPRKMQQDQRTHGLDAIDSARELQSFMVRQMPMTIHDAINQKGWSIGCSLHRWVVIALE